MIWLTWHLLSNLYKRKPTAATNQVVDSRISTNGSLESRWHGTNLVQLCRLQLIFTKPHIYNKAIIKEGTIDRSLCIFQSLPVQEVLSILSYIASHYIKMDKNSWTNSTFLCLPFPYICFPILGHSLFFFKYPSFQGIIVCFFQLHLRVNVKQK